MKKIQVEFDPEYGYQDVSNFICDKIFDDDIGGALLIVIDEARELLEMQGLKTPQGKEEDAMRGEMIMLIQKITQLGRSAGIHILISTQRNDASVIPGGIQANPLEINTPVFVKGRDKKDED